MSARVPDAGPEPICAYLFDSAVCVAPAGHEGPHVTSNARFPHGLVGYSPEVLEPRPAARDRTGANVSGEQATGYAAVPLPTSPAPEPLRAALEKALPAVRVAIAACSLGHLEGRADYWEAVEAEIVAALASSSPAPAESPE
jgi:hypothetical protein